MTPQQKAVRQRLYGSPAAIGRPTTGAVDEPLPALPRLGWWGWVRAWLAGWREWVRKGSK